MTELTMTTETTTPKPQPPVAGSGEYPLSTLSLRLEVDGVSLSWTLRGDDSDVASRLPRVLDYLKRLQAKLPKPEAPRPVAVPATPATPETPPQCLYHGPMKESTKAPGTWYCSKKLATGAYCDERWPKRAGEQSA